MTLPALIDVAVLVELMAQRDVLIVDCRFDLADPLRGAREHAQAHIADAVYASLDNDLSDLSKKGLGRHPLPDAAAFSATLGRWGWTPDIPVVAYDDASGAYAARLWWMLRLCGAGNAAVLDGGLAAWKGAGLPVGTRASARAATAVMVEFDPQQIVYTDKLLQIKQNILLLDARGAARYRGEVEPIDPVAGHVPGALNRPFQENLDAGGRFKSAEQLREEFLAVLGSHPVAEVVHMCGSGVTACHNLLAMERAGLSGSRIYAPSWSGWISDSSRPIARDTE